MSLISPEFAAFVAVTALLFHVSSAHLRSAMLALSSLLFCALNDPSAGLALLLATAGSYWLAVRMQAAEGQNVRRALLIAGLAVLLVHLLLIKLLPRFGGTGSWETTILGAFGASYYTFKLMGYLLDVYWRRYDAWSQPALFAAFACFFPLLPAGPIQRAGDFALQTDDARLAALMVYGLRRILLGLLKKLAVADQLGGIVEYIARGQPGHADLLWLMTYLFPLQLYADFSALTDIGVGVAAIFGVRAPENFDLPFFAPSISEFWRRWHMSLTRWMGDYLFMPLRMATRRLGNVGLALSIVINMVLIGMWHAISYGWLLFGLINAAFLIIDAFTVRSRQRIYKRRRRLSWLAAVTGPVLVYHMIAFSLVCFRAQTLPEIAYYFGHMLPDSPRTALTGLFYTYGRGRCAYAFAALCGFVVFEAGLYARQRGWTPVARWPSFAQWPRAARWSAYYLALLGAGLAGHQASRFIYIQF
jgi:alginate O-acetyltransferase complex protein AlgI